MLKFWSLVVIFVTVLSCNSKQSEQANVKKNNPINLVTTTGMLKDLAENLCPQSFNIQSLMGPGVDPHYYKASQGDLVKLQKADLIIFNGLHLEGKMGEVLAQLAKRKSVWEAGLSLSKKDIRKTGEFASGIDPHFWFDVKIWMKVCKALSIELQTKFPKYKNEIKKNETRYINELTKLDQFIINKLESVPVEKRLLYTAHDAFGYFGIAYNIEVLALQGLSTTTEFGLKDIQNAVDVILERKVKAIFVESSVSPKAIKAVVEQSKENGHELIIGGELFSDAMGDFDTPEGTYIGMLKHNINTFVKAIN